MELEFNIYLGLRFITIDNMGYIIVPHELNSVIMLTEISTLESLHPSFRDYWDWNEDKPSIISEFGVVKAEVECRNIIERLYSNRSDTCIKYINRNSKLDILLND